ncbi:hypothetical protein BDV98DRAFT_564680, partial [Pterulicium gracile]
MYLLFLSRNWVVGSWTSGRPANWQSSTTYLCLLTRTRSRRGTRCLSLLSHATVNATILQPVRSIRDPTASGKPKESATLQIEFPHKAKGTRSREKLHRENR